MLKMMAYKRANKILNSFLKPNEYCIARGTAVNSGADTTAMSNWITSQGYQSSDFPSNRLMPTDAIKYPGSTEFCYIPFDDLVMKLDNGQNGGGEKRTVDGVDYYAWLADAAMAGYQYLVTDVIYEDSNAVWGDGTDSDWLCVKINNVSSSWMPETPYGVMDTHPTINKVINVSDPTDKTASLIYYAKMQPSVNSPVRRAKVIIQATKDDDTLYSWNNNSTWYSSLTNPATNVCSIFSITVQQDAGNNNHDGEGAIKGTIPNNGTIKLSLTLNSTSDGANSDYVVMCRSVAGYGGYWTKSGYIGEDSSILSGRVSMQESGATENITIDIASIITDTSSQNNEIRFFVFGNWSGAINPGNGAPPKCNKGGFITTVMSNANNANSTNDITTHVFSSGNLNIPNASVEEILTRCTCLFEIKYVPVTGTSGNIVIKYPDEYDTWNHQGIDPIFMPAWFLQSGVRTNFTWRSDISSGLLSRVYNAVSASRQNTDILVISSDGGGKVAYKLSINSSDDHSQYSVIADGDTVTLDENNPIIIEGGVFLIDFSNVESGEVTKRFKLEQYIPSERPRVHDGNASPEYAEIAFTFQ